MPDAQIHPTGVEPTPARYLVPQSAELLLKGVFAKFDGSGAAGDFQPLLRIISDAGSTSIEAVSDTTVTAGASADVTWFPRVGGGGAAAPAALPAYALGYFDYLIGPSSGFQAVPANSNVDGKLVNVSTTNASAMDWSSVGVAGTKITLHARGTYLVVMKVLWDTVAPNADSIIQSFDQGDIPHSDYLTNPSTPIGDSIGQTNREDFTIAHVTGSSQSYVLLHMNQDPVDHAIAKQWLSVTYWPTG